jgi:formylmethanofuran dehydrogenase subunit E
LKKTASEQDPELISLLRKATDLHGHFGPWLTLGVRMGLLGLRELGAKKGEAQLHVTVVLQYRLPFSCMLDGIQATTGCTIGNKRLEWEESKQFGTRFLHNSDDRQVEVKIKSTIIKELQSRLRSTQRVDETVRQLALEISSRPEKELFSVTHK